MLPSMRERAASRCACACRRRRQRARRRPQRPRPRPRRRCRCRCRQRQRQRQRQPMRRPPPHPVSIALDIIDDGIGIAPADLVRARTHGHARHAPARRRARRHARHRPGRGRPGHARIGSHAGRSARHRAMTRKVVGTRNFHLPNKPARNPDRPGTQAPRPHAGLQPPQPPCIFMTSTQGSCNVRALRVRNTL